MKAQSRCTFACSYQRSFSSGNRALGALCHALGRMTENTVLPPSHTIAEKATNRRLHTIDTTPSDTTRPPNSRLSTGHAFAGRPNVAFRTLIAPAVAIPAAAELQQLKYTAGKAQSVAHMELHSPPRQSVIRAAAELLGASIGYSRAPLGAQSHTGLPQLARAWTELIHAIRKQTRMCRHSDDVTVQQLIGHKTITSATQSATWQVNTCT